jgi:hypothetical protein
MAENEHMRSVLQAIDPEWVRRDLADLERSIVRLRSSDTELNLIYASRVWRALAPYRMLRNWMTDWTTNSAWSAKLSNLRRHRLFQNKISRGASTPIKVGGLATMPSRADSLKACIESIVSQVDILYVYLDKYKEVPAFIKRYKNVKPILPQDAANLLGEARDWGASGKFIGTLLAGDCVYFCFDDDIIYPRDYSKRLGELLAALKYRALAGIHGATFQPPYESYANDRQYFHFADALERAQMVDLIGTGTLVFHTSQFKPDFQRWPTLSMNDFMVAVEAHRMGLPRVVMRRPKGYLKPVAELQDDSLWAAHLRDVSQYDNVMRQHPELWTRRIAAADQSIFGGRGVEQEPVSGIQAG